MNKKIILNFAFLALALPQFSQASNDSSAPCDQITWRQAIGMKFRGFKNHKITKSAGTLAQSRITWAGVAATILIARTLVATNKITTSPVVPKTETPPSSSEQPSSGNKESFSENSKWLTWLKSDGEKSPTEEELISQYGYAPEYLKKSTRKSKKVEQPKQAPGQSHE